MTSEEPKAGQQRRWHCFGNPEQLLAALAPQIIAAANAAIAERGAFRVVLAGGTTPARLYEQLAAADTDWRGWWIYFGDERCLPAGDTDRNDTMAQQAWLQAVSIPAVQIFPIPAELGPELGASRYAEDLKAVEQFDLVLLGLGEDGHTASLFPGHAVPTDRSVMPVHDAPKPPPERISLTPTRLAMARAVIFIVTGSGKQAALRQWETGAALPAALVAPVGGVDIYTDFDPRGST